MGVKQLGKLGIAACLLVGMLLACGAPSGPSIKAEDVWSRPAMVIKESSQVSEGGMDQGMGMAGTGAIFMRLVNGGKEPDRLVGGKTDVAKVVEIHETVMEGDVMKMKMLTDGLEIQAQGEVLLKPGGYHVMLIGLQRDLQVGDRFTAEMQFEKSGTLTVEAKVREP